MGPVGRVFRILWYSFLPAIYLTGVFLQFWVLLSPTPWFSTNMNLLSFVPYVQPEGYIPPNPCDFPSLSNSTVDAVENVAGLSIHPLRFARSLVDSFATERGLTPPNAWKRADSDSNTTDHSQRFITLGPLGSCSRDDDGSTWCSKPSYNHPQYNLTQLQANSYFYPQTINGNIRGEHVMAFAILSLLGFLAFALISIPFFFPFRFSEKSIEGIGALAMVVLLGHVLSGIGQFFANFSIPTPHIGDFNSVDNFYLPAHCGTVRQLAPGVLMMAQAGQGYKIMWAAWCLIYVIGTGEITFVSVWLGGVDGKKSRTEALKKREEALKLKALKKTPTEDKVPELGPVQPEPTTDNAPPYSAA